MRIDGIENAMKNNKSQMNDNKRFRHAIRDLTKRSASNSDLMKKGINYRFSLKDLPKYS